MVFFFSASQIKTFIVKSCQKIHFAAGRIVRYSAIFVIMLNNGTEKEYDLSMNEVNAFIAWYEGREAGKGGNGGSTPPVNPEDPSNY